MRGDVLMGSARPLFKADLELKVARLERALEKERLLRKEAELNARRFHALLLEARVAALAKRGER